MYKTTKALVLREVRYKEADRIITVLTPQDGRMTVKARGALRKNSVTAAATYTDHFKDGFFSVAIHKFKHVVSPLYLPDSAKSFRTRHATSC